MKSYNILDILIHSRPKVNLSRTSLNNTPLPDLFGVSNWVNSIVNDILSDVMVDPYKLDLDLSVRNNMTPAVNPRNSLGK